MQTLMLDIASRSEWRCGGVCEKGLCVSSNKRWWPLSGVSGSILVFAHERASIPALGV
jgi:hypothetical protein